MPPWACLRRSLASQSWPLSGSSPLKLASSPRSVVEPQPSLWRMKPLGKGSLIAFAEIVREGSRGGCDVFTRKVAINSIWAPGSRNQAVGPVRIHFV